jgi:hypothetical protein
MSDDVVVVAGVARELEPAARAFSAAVGQSGPVQELLAWISDETATGGSLEGQHYSTRRR